jgi:hypothetical protein
LTVHVRYAEQRLVTIVAKTIPVRSALSMFLNQLLWSPMDSPGGRLWNDFMSALGMENFFLAQPHLSKSGRDCHGGDGWRALRRFLEYLLCLNSATASSYLYGRRWPLSFEG